MTTSNQSSSNARMAVSRAAEKKLLSSNVSKKNSLGSIHETARAAVMRVANKNK